MLTLHRTHSLHLLVRGLSAQLGEWLVSLPLAWASSLPKTFDLSLLLLLYHIAMPPDPDPEPYPNLAPSDAIPNTTHSIETDTHADRNEGVSTASLDTFFHRPTHSAPKAGHRRRRETEHPGCDSKSATPPGAPAHYSVFPATTGSARSHP